MNVVLMGKGQLAIQIADWFNRSEKYVLAEIIPDMPEPVWAPSFSQWATTNGIPVVKSGNYNDCTIKNIDLCMSVFYGKIIKPNFISSCKKIINLHNSPLPKYRGVRPINWALKNNEKTHGVTIHEITPGIDDGPIYGQIIYPIYPDIEEVIDVYEKALEYGWLLFKDIIANLDNIKPIKQNKEYSYYSLKDAPRLGNRENWRRE